MNWDKPSYTNSRFGFEVTMYIYQKADPSELRSQAEPQPASLHWRYSYATLIKQSSLCLSTILLLMASGLSMADNGAWRFAGGSIHNTANAATETKISPANVGSLTTNWVYNTAADNSISADVTSAPAVLGNKLYVSDSSGNLTALDTRTKAVIWKKNFVTDYSNDPIMVSKGLKVRMSRATPAIIGNLLILGSGGPVGSTSNNFATNLHPSGAVILAVNRHTGNLVWATQVDDHPTAMITQSAVAKGNRVYVGVSSTESFLVAMGSILAGSPQARQVRPDYFYQDSSGAYHSKCCSFRGSMVALDINTGAIQWKFYTLPTSEAEKNWQNRPYGFDTAGNGKSWSGNAIWGDTPVIDLKRNTLYFGTGQTHTIPKSVLQANNLVYPTAHFTPPTAASYPDSTPVAGSYPASIIALDLSTGARKWSKSFGKLRGFDAWNGGCLAQFVLFGSPLPFNPNTIAYCPSNEDFSNLTTLDGAFYTASRVNNPFDFSLSSGGVLPLAVNGPFETAINIFPTDPPYNGSFTYPSGVSSWDGDFGQGPMMVRNIKMPNGSTKDLLIVAQKTGVARALDLTNNGTVLWQTFEGTGGLQGGYEFGSATDGKRIYLASNRPEIGFNNVTIKDVNGVASTTEGNGYFSALDIATGAILWETVAPFGVGAANVLSGQIGPGEVVAPLSVGNGVVYGGINDDNGTMIALNAATGQILFTFPTGNKAAGNPSNYSRQRVTIMNGALYFGSGLGGKEFGNSVPNVNKLFKLTLPSSGLENVTDTDDNDNDLSGKDDL